MLQIDTSRMHLSDHLSDGSKRTLSPVHSDNSSNKENKAKLNKDKSSRNILRKHLRRIPKDTV